MIHLARRFLQSESVSMRSITRAVCFAALMVCGSRNATAEQPPDLSEYRTVATAQTATPAALVGGERRPGYLGVNAEPDAGGLRVAAVEPESPAALADIRAGDYLRIVDGVPVADLSALRDVLFNRREGDRFVVGGMREKKAIEFVVTLGAPSRPLTANTPSRRVVLGVQLVPAENGVKIDRLTPNLAAEKAGVKVGDVLLKVGSAAVASQEALQDVLSGKRPGDKVQLTLKREGKEVAVEALLSADPTERFRGNRAQDDDMPTLARWDDRRPRVFRQDKYRLAAIEVAFSDAKANEKITSGEWEKALFSKGEYKDKSATGQSVYGSMNDYYQEISGGKFSVTGKVFAPVTCTKKRNDYSTSSNRFAMFTEALDLLLARDGKDALNDFDGLFFVYAGNRVQTQRGGIYWPHKSNLRYQGKSWNYFICPEGGDRMSSISVMSHEFGHMLGLPDLYAKPENPGSEGVGVWCTMSTGHGRDGKPLHFSAWCKDQLGWIKPCVIDPRVKQKLILAPIENAPNECYKVLIRPDASEYLLLENRLKKGYDRDIPGEGLLIWRVLDGKPVLEESHGIGGPDGPMRFLGSVPYPSKSNTAFTPYTTPSSKPSKPGGVPVHITNIRRLPDGRITFHIGYEYL
jgi:M6 family metalloprotease-like protein